MQETALTLQLVIYHLHCVHLFNQWPCSVLTLCQSPCSASPLLATHSCSGPGNLLTGFTLWPLFMFTFPAMTNYVVSRVLSRSLLWTLLPTHLGMRTHTSWFLSSSSSVIKLAHIVFTFLYQFLGSSKIYLFSISLISSHVPPGTVLKNGLSFAQFVEISITAVIMKNNMEGPKS